MMQMVGMQEMEAIPVYAKLKLLLTQQEIASQILEPLYGLTN